MNKDTRTILEEAGLKITQTRLAILSLFSKDCNPINAEYILKNLHHKNVNLVTIYRSLSTFTQKGILRPVNINKESAHYELASHHHHHLICKDCGDIEEIGICNKRLDKDALAHSKKFETIESHSVEFLGICKKCRV